MYDYMLEGKDNFAVDRAAADRIIEQIPQAVATARANRAFLRRVVRFLAAEAGIGQFIDIGAGLPAMDNVHQVAQRAAPGARVAYVDHDPVAVAHGRALLATSPLVTSVEGDLLDPAGIIGNKELRTVVDFGEPVAIMLLAVLHFIPDEEDPWKIVGQLTDALPAGSYLAISHATSDLLTDASQQLVQDVYKPTASGGATPRPLEEISRFLDGWTPVAPGLVDISDWHPDEPGARPERTLLYGGVACKRRKPMPPAQMLR
jgi:hypothetical protein